MSKAFNLLISVLVVLILVYGIVFPGARIYAANAVDIGHSMYDIIYPPNHPMDTLWVGMEASIDFYYQNDITLGGYVTGFKFWSPDGALWEYDSALFDIVYNPITLQFDTIYDIITVVQGSRQYPHSEVWDGGGLEKTYTDIDKTGYDTIIWGGMRSVNGMQPGPLERQVRVHMMFGGTAGNQVKAFCVDSAKVGSLGDFVFMDVGQQTISPTALWPEGGKCFAVKLFWYPPPVFVGYCPRDAGYVNLCSVGSVSLQAYSYSDSYIMWRATHNGHGFLYFRGLNTSGFITYYPSPLDVDNDVTVTVEIYDDYHPVGSSCAVTFSVTGEMPTFEAGMSFDYVGINNTFRKQDIAIDDPMHCLDYEYQLVSGPGAVDPESGEYTWAPTIDDLGHHEIVIAAIYQGNEIVTDNFTLDVVDDEDNPGDANCDGNTNIGDAVFVLNHVFKYGPVPPIANWGDANGDCTINIGDGVRLVGASFSTGPMPVSGCVE